MIMVAIILGLVIIGLIILINYLSRSGYDDMNIGFLFRISLIILCIVEMDIVNDIIEESQPTAMDVYRGKTILEYTIRDREIIDSVVIFKENYGND